MKPSPIVPFTKPHFISENVNHQFGGEIILATEHTPLSLLPVVLEWVKYRLTPSNRVFGALGIILWEFGKETHLLMHIFQRMCATHTALDATPAKKEAYKVVP